MMAAFRGRKEERKEAGRRTGRHNLAFRYTNGQSSFTSICWLKGRIVSLHYLLYWIKEVYINQCGKGRIIPNLILKNILPSHCYSAFLVLI